MKKNIVKIGLLSALTFVGVNNHSFASVNEHVCIINEELQTATFKVYGNCGMCEKTIEGALKFVKGIEKADWNKETKMMEVTFDENLISLKEIKQKIADVGYDTDDVRASEKAYSRLPGCCQYERPESKQEEHNHDHKH